VNIKINLTASDKTVNSNDITVSMEINMLPAVTMLVILIEVNYLSYKTCSVIVTMLVILNEVYPIIGHKKQTQYTTSTTYFPYYTSGIWENIPLVEYGLIQA